MPSILRTFRVLSDASRLRILRLLEAEELSVAELLQILAVGQSTLSTHLSQLRQAGLVEDRRTGKNVLYRLKDDSPESLRTLIREAAAEIPETAADDAALALALDKRRDRSRAYFDELAGKFGKHYVPGRSWKGLAEALLKLMPPMTVADLGAGEGTFSQLLAQRAERVIAVDNSAQMVQYGADLAREHGLRNIDYRLGDMENLPIEDSSVDLAFFSQSLHHAQHPRRAVQEAFRILKPGGRIAILDLLKHHMEEARDLYADQWLGFSEVELRAFLTRAGFEEMESAIVHKEEQAPHFETLMAVALKPQPATKLERRSRK
ncbi:MAG: metalloregulator ArsR/SmtB family transcription factor [Acidobacteria bacterium]|nr:metalloregulator ArsR/SmtB family transcription factor [Acidobacteriota bacterium]